MSQHETAAKLLPWFVNGSLNESEHALVDAHIKICESCQVDLKQIFYVSNEINDLSVDWNVNHEQARLKFAAMLGSRDNRITEPYGRSATLTLTSCAGLLLIAALGMLFLPQEDSFETMSSNSPSASTVLQIIFSDNTSERSMHKILFAEGNTVLSGPTRLGVYRVSIGPPVQIDETIEKFRNNSNIRFVELEQP